MAGNFSEQLKERHEYETWRGQNELNTNLFVWKFFLSGNEFRGWHLYSHQVIEDLGEASCIQSVWHTNKADALLIIDIFECGSREAAHEVLIELLGQAQSPHVERMLRAKVGDVAFAGGTDTDIMFARANLVLAIRNAGPEMVPVAPAAARFDKLLVNRPRANRVEDYPVIRRFEGFSPDARVGTSIPIDLAAADPAGNPIWYKFFSKSGEVHLIEGRPHYQPLDTGRQEVTVFAVNPERGTMKQSLSFYVS